METPRYPISVRLTGVIHKQSSKMFVTSVLWSDNNDIVVYRGFRDFEKMHKQLKKEFPAASKLNTSDRIIPKFQVKKMKLGGQRKGPAKSLECLKFLQKYCNELLSCDPRVCQCASLIQFFHPKGQDLQPDFSKNSIMIMPSEDEIGTDVGHGNSGSVTQPFVMETYRCVAPYETKDTKNKPFKVAANEKLDVLIKDKTGWWLVESEDKQIAWFPAPYLERLDDDDIDEAAEKGTLYTAVKSYKATKDDEITVTIGALVEVLQKSDNGWWLIRYNGKAGYIPTMYLQPYNCIRIHMTTHHQDRRDSAPANILSSRLEQCQQLPPARSSSAQQRREQRSHSLNIFSQQPPAHLAASAFAAIIGTTPAAAKQAAPHTIIVESDGEEVQHGRSLATGSERSLASAGSEFSFSDDLSSSSESLSLNLNHNTGDEQLRVSHTPPPIPSNRLSPTSCPEKKIILSASDPLLYKGHTAPKVPPRPQAQEILARCTSITCKNVVGSNLSATQTEILSR